MPRSKVGVALTQERNTTHGSFDDVASTFARFLATVHNMPNWSRLSPTKQMALGEIFHKVARIGHGDPEHPDHWNDIAGYGELGGRNCAPPAPSLRKARKRVPSIEKIIRDKALAKKRVKKPAAKKVAARKDKKPAAKKVTPRRATKTRLVRPVVRRARRPAVAAASPVREAA
jgi:hypothetical protein